MSKTNQATKTFKAVLERYIELYAKVQITTWKSVQGTLRLHVAPTMG
ncbi:MAG: hypothetical protein O6852_10915 [Gammaproteobacteria bacterium]|nr:hypothetical protein [Gammaproteobacteria bacterium]